MENTKLKKQILGGILGLAVADALGVPVEFQDRESLRRNPVTDMRGYGAHNQPPGTWSDDTSLTLCLLDSLVKENRFDSENAPERLDYEGIMQRFLSWMDKAEYTAHNEVFDIGNATRQALLRFRKGIDPLECGGTSEQDNGNGSLMRILPIIFYFPRLYNVLYSHYYAASYQADCTCFSIVHNVSSLTHAHKRSQIACGIYFSVAYQLLKSGNRKKLQSAVKYGLKAAKERYKSGIYKEQGAFVDELKHYNRIFRRDFAKLPEEKIESTGYVVDTLEAALWCLLNTDNYKDCVLKAVNLGNDTDTVAAVAGGLAGMFYGVDGIPKEWLDQLARRNYIEKLCEDFYRSLHSYKGTKGTDTQQK